jgi:cation diffusion facilitator CzcD-associated flavoprotein CzcO
MTTTEIAPPDESAAAEHWDAQVCLIGAGASGLAAGKALAERGITFDWFEKGSMVGGLWQIENDNGAVAAYKTLHLNSSRERTEFPSFPMPSDWPDYPHHSLIAGYFEDYARHFDLQRRITFHAEVTHVEPLPGDGAPGSHGWAVTTTATGTRHYPHVIVANGHHSRPRIPAFPGEFTGTAFHAHDYRDPSVFADKTVVVIGVGNSGMDISCDAAKLAKQVYLVTRRGVHVLPKYAFGRPIDTLGNPLMAYVPLEVERRVYELIVRASVGRPQDRGLPAPDHRLLGAHPTVSAELYDRVGHGDIVMKPQVDSLDGQEIHFVDGTTVEADVLVYATGYDVALPFFSPEVYDPAHNQMPLFQRILSPQRPGLFFVGFIQTVGANIPLYEYQAEWIGDLLTGRVVRPTDAEMSHWIERDQAAMAKRYTRSDRHTMQVDYWRYIRSMKELRARKSHRSLVDRATAPLAGLR